MRLNDAKAEKLKKEKADILETVMETETYKVAKEILEKFGGELPVNRPLMVILFSRICLPPFSLVRLRHFKV
jgi:hypothetical protein